MVSNLPPLQIDTSISLPLNDLYFVQCKSKLVAVFFSIVI